MPGAWWTWAPLDSSRFEIQWGGIDGALSYVVQRRSKGLVSQETFFSGNRGGSETTQPAQVRSASCQSAAG